MGKPEINLIDEYNFLKTGDKIPRFQWTNNSGILNSIENLSGKFTLIILFAADCPHCKSNFAHLEQNLFSKYSGSFNSIGFGRDCSPETIEIYKKNNNIQIPLFPDPNKEIYLKFAEKAIPRNYLFDESGLLVLTIRGYKPDENARMIDIILRNKEST